MKSMNSIHVALAASMLVLASAGAAQAQVNKTFVRSNGTDTGTCAITAPCVSFQYAYTQTNAGGSIIALDTGGFGYLTLVNKAITIEAVPGAIAYIKPTTGIVGVPVAGISTDSVVLRNLHIDCQNAASSTGVRSTGASKLLLENVTIHQCAEGLRVTNAKAVVSDSTFVGNGVALYSDGTGSDGNSTSIAMIMVSGGKIVNNQIALYQTNTTSSLYNIFLQAWANTQGAWYTNVVNNNTIFAGTPTQAGQYFQGSFGVK
jgi:hypothetical protein